MPHTFWSTLLGLLLAGYLALDGYAFGVGMLGLRLGRDEPERRLLLNAVGPYFLGNEVWIVATAGILFGAVPDLEGALLSGFYPLVVLLIGALITRDAGMWFRSRRQATRWRTGWDLLIAIASLAMAFGWGLVLGDLVRGVPVGRAAPGGVELFSPYALMCGASFTVLVLLHGAVFTALRTESELALRAVGVARQLVAPAAAGLMTCVGIGFIPTSGGVPARPILAAAVVLAALAPLAVLPSTLAARRHGLALCCTVSSVGLVVLGVGAGIAPRVLDALAAAGTLQLLGGAVLVVLPVLVAAQIWLWWAFRGRVGPSSSMYF